MLCQFWPQLRDNCCQLLLLEPLTDTETTSPAPPTLVISTRLKYECPLIVNLIPPLFLQATLSSWKINILVSICNPIVWGYWRSGVSLELYVCNVINTFCIEQGQFLLCIEQCVGRSAGRDQNAAREGYTTLHYY